LTRLDTSAISLAVLAGSQLVFIPIQYMHFLSVNVVKTPHRLIALPECLYLMVPPLLTTAAVFGAACSLFPARPRRWLFAVSVVLAWAVAVVVMLVGTGVTLYWRAKGHG
jgi:hypothetical protein